MEKKTLENNQAIANGEIVSGFEFSYETFGEGFYIVYLSSKRKSGAADIIPVMVSNRLVPTDENWTGNFVTVSGQFRSYNKHENGRSRLALSLFALSFDIEEETGKNNIFLDGYICKEPIYRNTPLGREIADLLIAVNRSYGKSDYIPCICWGRNARFASGFTVGSHVQIWGRIQSREYQKKKSETEHETRTAYEVSVSKINIMEKGDIRNE